ncbi:MAG: hypothetical protein KJ789_02275, partial [Alphaproteobacteria bacterium]|nr:hypothetical protein [Alphaproteobacteria bacterium]
PFSFVRVGILEEKSPTISRERMSARIGVTERVVPQCSGWPQGLRLLADYVLAIAMARLSTGHREF